MGAHLPGWEDGRKVKCSDFEPTEEHESKYWGEHNFQDQPHGRGVVLLANGTIVMRYFWEGLCVPGPYINLTKEGKTIVGMRTVDEEGNWFIEGYTYDADGIGTYHKRQSEILGHVPQRFED